MKNENRKPTILTIQFHILYTYKHFYICCWQTFSIAFVCNLQIVPFFYYFSFGSPCDRKCDRTFFCCLHMSTVMHVCECVQVQFSLSAGSIEYAIYTAVDAFFQYLLNERMWCMCRLHYINAKLSMTQRPLRLNTHVVPTHTHIIHTLRLLTIISTQKKYRHTDLVRMSTLFLRSQFFAHCVKWKLTFFVHITFVTHMPSLLLVCKIYSRHPRRIS